MWTEAHDWAPPDRISPSLAAGALADVTLEWGEEIQIGAGKTFPLGDEEDSAFVAKSWVRTDPQHQFLIEAVRQSDLVRLSAKVPKGAAAANPAQAARGIALKVRAQRGAAD